MKKLNLILIASTLIACKQIHLTKETTQVEITKNDIVNTIVNDKESFYYLDFSNYPNNDINLPIGVFDSGIGGLTVLKTKISIIIDIHYQKIQS